MQLVGALHLTPEMFSDTCATVAGQSGEGAEIKNMIPNDGTVNMMGTTTHQITSAGFWPWTAQGIYIGNCCKHKMAQRSKAQHFAPSSIRPSVAARARGWARTV